MIHWRQLTTKGRIDAIRDVWVPGCSTAQIAAHMEGATRNAIIGMYHRFPNSLTDRPLVSRGIAGNTSKAREEKKRKQSPEANSLGFLWRDIAGHPFRAQKAAPKLPAPKTTASEHRLCGKPLMLLQAKECKWPVNEAARGELHLFCAMPTEGTYCEHHKMRAYQAGS